MSNSKLFTLFSAATLALGACGKPPEPPPPGPTTEETIAIANANKAAADSQLAAAQAQIKASEMTYRIPDPSQTQPQQEGDIGKDCVEGATKALKVTGIATGIGCFADLFISGGALCLIALHAAIPTAATAAAGGCAVGIVNSPDDAAYAGIPSSPTSQQQGRNLELGANPPAAAPAGP